MNHYKELLNALSNTMGKAGLKMTFLRKPHKLEKNSTRTIETIEIKLRLGDQVFTHKHTYDLSDEGSQDRALIHLICQMAVYPYTVGGVARLNT